MRNVEIVGDFTHEKPFMVVEYFKGKNNYVGHKILSRFKTEEEVVKEINTLHSKKQSEDKSQSKVISEEITERKPLLKSRSENEN